MIILSQVSTKNFWGFEKILLIYYLITVTTILCAIQMPFFKKNMNVKLI